MKAVLKVSITEFTLKTGGDIERAIDDYCKSFRIAGSYESQNSIFGYKYLVVLQGAQENVETVIKLLKQKFRVKRL